MSLADITWRMRGACHGLDPSIFFPDDDEQADVAKEICDECDVRVACLEYALTTRERDGVWEAPPNASGAELFVNVDVRRRYLVA